MASNSTMRRPTFHFVANSWINDPCAPGYDSQTGTYHLFYQTNPASCEWGNMSWGHIVSKNLLSWTQATSMPALAPDTIYDSQGVFTGCWIPADERDRTLRVAYTSVKELPFHWSTPPYPRDAAGLSIAASDDGGKTWVKTTRNPVLKGEPPGLDVTGFRDPYVTDFPVIDEARGIDTVSLYGLISGGLQGSGPTTFLYEIQRDDIEVWKYLNPLVDLPERWQPSKKWSGNYGTNWECTNLVELEAGTENRHFLIIGAEGDVRKDHENLHKQPTGAPLRTVRAQLWMSGRLVTTDDGIKFQYQHGGYLDHGPCYAANSFLDPQTSRRILYSWIPEEDLTLEAAKKKGWNGSLAVPREIFLLRIPDALEALQSSLQDISPFELKIEPDGSTTVLTLGVRPISELDLLRKTSRQLLRQKTAIPLPESEMVTHQALFQPQSANWELEAAIAVTSGCQQVGFYLRHNEDLSIRTTVVFSVTAETITVERDASNNDPAINKCPDSGPFTLLTTQGPDGPILEKLRLRIFSDGDILEVFANDRFALATMVYSGNNNNDEESTGVAAFATGKVNSGVFEAVTLWDGLDWEG